MVQSNLIDHSPYHPSPAPQQPTASNLILIDNYDSFTWNVYQYLILEGASVTVFRNDEISLEDLIAKNPTQLVISPGPGHPDRDAGISKNAIKYFGGKIPVLGVCMGEQCIYSVYGGRVDVTGEILHGKTSPLRHDTKGVYAGLPQDLPVTRYHSLAGTHTTLPDCLEVTSWIATGPDGGKGVIMGVRHKEFLVEGVQFHPESILTANGRMMLKNFLRMQGGTWAENERLLEKQLTNGTAVNGTSQESKARSTNILETIFAHRKSAVAAQKDVPSQRPSDLQAAYDLNLAPPLIPFAQRLKKSPYSLSLMAEIKRASPSKGIISLNTCAPAQARTYALAGASVISVLTEPEWFKGSIDDLRAVRQSLEGMPDRPAVLRKEFIFDEYQILEARLAGADTVLLIVKMLDIESLKRLYLYSQSLGMEPLVEVNTVEEMQIALDLGSQVIGVNNRNLTNFEVDLDTTSRLMDGVPKDTVICALSGISGPKDVEAYRTNGVGAVLVGEALMRAPDTVEFIKRLLHDQDAVVQEVKSKPKLVKICGTRSAAAAKAAVEAGADLIGIILVTGRKRLVSDEVAQEISHVVHASKKPGSIADQEKVDDAASDYFQHSVDNYIRASPRALLVGVFQNQPLQYILDKQRLLSLDIVQLHGSEPLEWAGLIPVPVIRSFQPGEAGMGNRGYHAIPLLDGGSGGSGTTLNDEDIVRTLQKDRGVSVFLAGGLNPENVAGKLAQLRDASPQIVGFDVSSGVEEDGQQSIAKIQAFIQAVKAL